MKDAQIKELMELGDTPLTGNGFVAACQRVLDKKHSKEDLDRCEKIRDLRNLRKLVK